jgi:hypothetical protein
MSQQMLDLIVNLITLLGPPGLFVVAWIWERRRTQLVVDRHLSEQSRVYEKFLQEQRELYERYLEDMREWASPRDRSRIRFDHNQATIPAGSEMRALRSTDLAPAPGD